MLQSYFPKPEIPHGLMDFGFLKGCGSVRLVGTFYSQVGVTIHANKFFTAKTLPKYTYLSSFMLLSLYAGRRSKDRKENQGSRMNSKSQYNCTCIKRTHCLISLDE